MMMKTRNFEDYDLHFTKPFPKDCAKLSELLHFNQHKLSQLITHNTLSASSKSFLLKSPFQIENLIAVDCEMVETDGDKMTLARVSAVNAKEETIMDFLVRPSEDLSFVKDYRTFITGLAKSDFDDVSISLQEAQNLFKSKVGENTIVVGHAVHHDLLSLRIVHSKVIDTSFLFLPPTPTAAMNKVNVKLNSNQSRWGRSTHSLAFLSEKVLKQDMAKREESEGVHDSIEDALQSLRLLKVLFRNELMDYELPQMEKPKVKVARKSISNDLSLQKVLKHCEKKRDPPKLLPSYKAYLNNRTKTSTSSTSTAPRKGNNIIQKLRRSVSLMSKRKRA